VEFLVTEELFVSKSSRKSVKTLHLIGSTHSSKTEKNLQTQAIFNNLLDQ